MSFSEAMRPYAIATRGVFGDWPTNDPAIKAAHRAFDAGQAEVCQGREGGRVVLFCIPRRVPAPSRAYFLVRETGYNREHGFEPREVD
jgi:hypothetical protein